MKYYLIPKIGTGQLGDAFRPKYDIEGEIPGGMTHDPYGDEPFFLTYGELTDEQSDSLTAFPDVIEIPDNPQDISTKLETLKIPTDELPVRKTDAMVYLKKIFDVMDKFRYKGLNPLQGKTLDTVVDAQHKDDMKNVADIKVGDTLRKTLLDLSKL